VIWAIFFGLFVGLAIGWVCGIAYGVRQEQQRQIDRAWRWLKRGDLTQR
jgi:hypothetical protein